MQSYSSSAFQAGSFRVEELRKPLNTWAWLESTMCLQVWSLSLHHTSLTDSLSLMISILFHFDQDQERYSDCECISHVPGFVLVYCLESRQMMQFQTLQLRPIIIHHWWFATGRGRSDKTVGAFWFNMIEHPHGPLKETVASPGRISSTQPNRVIFQTFDTSVAVLPTVWRASIEWLGCKASTKTLVQYFRCVT